MTGVQTCALPIFDLGLVHLAVFQTECHIVPDGEVWEDGIVLEHHADVALAGVHIVDALLVEEDVAALNGVEAVSYTHLAAKYLHKDYRVYAILGDGEIQEGQVWEAAESAVKYGLDNFVVLLDHNGLQIDGTNDQVMASGTFLSYSSALFFFMDEDLPKVQIIPIFTNRTL